MTSWRRTLWIMVFVQLVSTLGFSTINPFLALYVEDLGSATGMSLELLAGLVFSSQAVAMMLIAPVWGALADRHGRKLMVERATFGGAIIILLMGFVRSGEELVLLRVMQGLITGVVAATSALVAGSVPRERVGFAVGLLQMGMWGGISIGPLVGGIVADQFGFRASFLITSLLLAVAGVLVWRGVDEHFTARPILDSGRTSILAEWRHVLSMSGVAPTYTMRFVSFLGQTMLTPFAPLFVQELLPGSARVATLTGVVVAVSSMAGTMSAVYFGRLGDRIGHKRILIAGSLASAVFFIPQSFVTTVWQLLLLQMLTGITTGGILPSLSALLVRYTVPGQEGAVYGLENSIASGARAIAPLVGAPLVAAFGLRSVFTTTGILFLVATGFALTWLPNPTSERSLSDKRDDDESEPVVSLSASQR